jgi:hypothetical protein
MFSVIRWLASFWIRQILNAIAPTIGVVGTGIYSPPALMQNTLDALTQKKIAPYLADIVNKPSPTHWALQRSGKHVTGGALIFPLLTAEDPAGGAFWGDQNLNTSVFDPVIPAEQQWRFYYQNIAIATTDIILGSGGASAVDIVKAKMQIGAASLLPKLARANWGIYPQNTSIDIDNIPNWIGVQGNTIAGVNRSTVTAWNPGAAVSNGSGALTIPNFEQAYQSVTFGYDEPDTLFLNNYDYGRFKTQFINAGAAPGSVVRMNDNITDKEPAQLGLRYHFRVDNAVVLADQYITAGTGWLWNSKYMWMNYHKNGYYVVRPWLMSSSQEVIASRIVVAEQLTNVRPLSACTITNLT